MATWQVKPKMNDSTRVPTQSLLAHDRCQVKPVTQQRPKGKPLKPQVNPPKESKPKAIAHGEVAVLQPYANELVRLARDITHEIKSGEVSPRCLSGLTALAPLVAFLQKATFGILRASDDLNDEDDDDDVEEDGDDVDDASSTPGYL